MRSRNNSNAVNRAAVDADAKIMFSDKIQEAKRERSEADERPRLGMRLGKSQRRRGGQGRQRQRLRLRLWKR